MTNCILIGIISLYRYIRLFQLKPPFSPFPEGITLCRNIKALTKLKLYFFDFFAQLFLCRRIYILVFAVTEIDLALQSAVSSFLVRFSRHNNFLLDNFRRV